MSIWSLALFPSRSLLFAILSSSSSSYLVPWHMLNANLALFGCHFQSSPFWKPTSSTKTISKEKQWPDFTKSFSSSCPSRPYRKNGSTTTLQFICQGPPMTGITSLSSQQSPASTWILFIPEQKGKSHWLGQRLYFASLELSFLITLLFWQFLDMEHGISPSRTMEVKG